MAKLKRETETSTTITEDFITFLFIIDSRQQKSTSRQQKSTAIDYMKDTINQFKCLADI